MCHTVGTQWAFLEKISEWWMNKWMDWMFPRFHQYTLSQCLTDKLINFGQTVDRHNDMRLVV